MQADLRRTPEAMHHPLVLPTHLRTPGGDPPSPEQTDYVLSIAPAFEALRRLLVLAAVDGRIMVEARKLDVPPWLDPKKEGKLPAPGRWAVLMGLVVHPEATCQWLAWQEVAKATGVVGKRAREALVKAKAAELLARVPWAGHVWERQHGEVHKGTPQDQGQTLREDGSS